MENFKITKPIRLIELFSGYGSQHFALKYLNANFESWKTCEWAYKSIQAYKDAHFSEDNIDYSSKLEDKEVFDFLYNKGISSNYNSPMTYEQIKRLGIEKARTIYNNIFATHNLVNIQQVKGSDLEVIDSDKFCYLMTYSFPCQDLSVAGLGKGMEKGSDTRSGMLWEVERILDEIVYDGGQLPQVLLMENVPQVHGSKNREHFNTWVEKLKKLGYSNYWQDLNAKDFGVPQNRNRCFMVSILGDFSYKFPKPIQREKNFVDLLEEEVDESFFLSDSKIKSISQWKAHQDPLKDINKEKEICPCLTARGAGEEHSGMILINENVYNLKTKSKGNNMVLKNEEPLRKEVCNRAISECLVEPTDMIDYTYSNSRLNEINKGFINTKNKEDNTISCTLTTGVQNLAVCVEDEDNLRIRKLTPKECFRLMGIKDNDFEKIAKNQTNQSLYHMSGDSIVVDVLQAIFKELLC